MPEWLKNSLKWERTDFPALIKYMLHLASYVATVVATIYFAPIVNQEFEAENRKTVFYISTINALSSDTKEVLGDLTVYLDPKIDQSLKSKLRLEIRKKLTSLHWRRVEFALIYRDDRISKLLREYADSLNTIDRLLSKSDPDNAEIQEGLKLFGLVTARLVQYLGRKAGV